MSKTALNQLGVTLSVEFKENADNVTIISLYPGYLATRLSSFRSRNDMDECITGMVSVIETIGIERSGQYINWKGETMPW